MSAIERVVLIKGYGAPHGDRWQSHEKRYAEAQGMAVDYLDPPDFHSGAHPMVQTFRAHVERALEQGGTAPEKTAVLAHSLAGKGWLHVLAARTDLRACLTWLIGTPLMNRTGVEEIADFFPSPPMDLSTQERERIRVIGSDSDPIIREHPAVLARHLGVAHETIRGAGHFMPLALHKDAAALDLGGQWIHVRKRLGLPY